MDSFISYLFNINVNTYGGILIWFLGILNTITTFLFQILGRLAALLINAFAVANPFSDLNFASQVWKIFKNIAYLGIIFASLYIGILFIINHGEEARKKIFVLILIALLINFSFFFAEEIFNIFNSITYSLACLFTPANSSDVNNCHYVGTAIFASLSHFSPSQLTEQATQGVAANISNQTLRVVPDLAFELAGLALSFLWTAFMFIFAGIFVGRFIFIALLVGFLPLAIVSTAFGKNSNHLNQTIQSFLKWSALPAILLLMILVGFSLISTAFTQPITTGSANGVGGATGDFYNTFVAPAQQGAGSGVNGGLLGSSFAIGPYILMTVFRFIFIAIYYGFAIIFAIDWAGKFAGGGMTAARTVWANVIGGGIKWTSQKAMSPVREKMGSKLKDWSTTMGASGIAGTAKFSKQLESLSESLLKPKKEREEIRGKALVEKTSGNPDKVKETMSSLIQDKNYGVLKNFLQSTDIDWDTEDWVRNISGIPGIKDSLKDEKLRAVLAKKWRGFNSPDKESMIAALAKINISSAGGWDQLEPIVSQTSETAGWGGPKGTSTNQILSDAWLKMPANQKMEFGSRLDHFNIAKNLGFTDDRFFNRGFVATPELNALMTAKGTSGETLAATIALIEQGNQKSQNKASAALNSLAAIQNNQDIVEEIRKNITDKNTRDELANHIDSIIGNVKDNSGNPYSLNGLGLNFRD
ncbi:MAG: hypothetical protein M1505_02670 [Patescibacteria group bacterium]|nr:hypothetical protein [Patescibacteria group bacterium]